MNSPVPVGLVGIGGFGQRHLNTLSTLQSAGLCRILAVADPFAAGHEDTVAALRALEIEVLDDITALLDREQIEACFVATPIALHVPQALAALRAGKHVYLEKPPCVTLDEWTQLCRAKEDAGTECAIGFQLQTTPAIKFLKAQILAGALGRLQNVWASVRWRRTDEYYNRSGWAGKWLHNGHPVFDGPATNALSHVVHAALYLTGTQARKWGVVQQVRGCLKKARPIESYDTSFLEAQTVEGTEVRLAFTHATEAQDEVVLHCSGEGGEAELEWNGTVRITRRGQATEHYHFFCESHYASTLDFLKAVRDPDSVPATTLQDCLPYLQLVNGALQSSDGAAQFSESRVHRVGEGAPGAYYVVDRLDDEFLRFDLDFAQAPEQLEPGTWIAADEIKPHLVVAPQPVEA